MVLIFLHYPLIKNAGNKQEGSPIMVTGRLVDLGFCALALFAGYQIIQFDYNDINYLLFGLANMDLLAGVVFTLLLPCLYYVISGYWSPRNGEWGQSKAHESQASEPNNRFEVKQRCL
ncbi:hypothetical protein [Salinisphaera sp. G21_0]|uniref:hypothetical protein n=1 Tax=Salinisphaera sp. G21_0 TaxID=2821094 RepID=UPI001AD95441|nr:hypothetical protein [Salinisphaera sp. G21_0]MBO9481358.1 hypothetical protein [Salinisphaera sp. G21_0]